MTSQEVLDPTVEVYFGGEEKAAAVWFLASEVHAVDEMLERVFGKPDADEDLSAPESDIPMVVVCFEDGTARTWLPGSEIDAMSEKIVQRFGEPDGVS